MFLKLWADSSDIVDVVDSDWLASVTDVNTLIEDLTM